MAVVHILQKDYASQRRHSVVHPPGTSGPVYLGSRWDGDTVQITGVIVGSSYDDAKSTLDTIRALVKSQDQVTIGVDIGTLAAAERVTGKIERLSANHSPVTRYQRFSMTLRVYN